MSTVPRYVRGTRVLTYLGDEDEIRMCLAKSLQPYAPRHAGRYTIATSEPTIEVAEKPPVYRTAGEENKLLRQALQRLVDICEQEALLPDGSSPDTLAARSLLKE